MRVEPGQVVVRDEAEAVDVAGADGLRPREDCGRAARHHEVDAQGVERFRLPQDEGRILVPGAASEQQDEGTEPAQARGQAGGRGVPAEDVLPPIVHDRDRLRRDPEVSGQLAGREVRDGGDGRPTLGKARQQHPVEGAEGGAVAARLVEHVRVVHAHDLPARRERAGVAQVEQRPLGPDGQDRLLPQMTRGAARARRLDRREGRRRDRRRQDHPGLRTLMAQEAVDLRDDLPGIALHAGHGLGVEAAVDREGRRSRMRQERLAGEETHIAMIHRPLAE